MKIKRAAIILFLLLIIVTGKLSAEEDIINLTVRDADIRDVLIMLTDQTGINLVPDETVQGRVTLDLKKVGLNEALKTLTIAYDYRFNQISDNVYLVSRKKFSVPADIKVKDNKLTIHVKDGDLREVLNDIADKADINIIMDKSVSGNISIDLEKIPLELGLANILQVNGYSLSKSSNIYRVFRSEGGSSRNNLSITILDGKLSIDAQQANLGNILRTISRLASMDMVIFSGVREVVDLKLEEVPIEKGIDIILSGTRFTYRKVNDIYLIGEKNINSPTSSLLTTSELIPLEYLQVEKVPQLLPNNFPASNVKVIKEKNALLVTGTQSEIGNLRKYIAKVDTKIPLIVVDALVIELSNNRNESPAMKLGISDDNLLLDSALGQLTYKSIMDLPKDFHLNIQSLVGSGEATIKASPNITTLNGQQARIDVGNVQYYKVIKTDEDGNEETKYQSINAGVTLDVTPWVSSSGEITLKLQPTVSNIGGAAAEGPPQISRREVNTTVRVKDGQTVVIGGLIQDVGSKSSTKVPVLGDLPIIGGLFGSSNNNINQTELVIYITPHVLKENEEKVEQDMKRMIEKTELLEEEQNFSEDK